MVDPKSNTCAIRLFAEYFPNDNGVVVYGIEDHCENKSFYTFDHFRDFYLKYFDTCPNFRRCLKADISSPKEKKPTTTSNGSSETNDTDCKKRYESYEFYNFAFEYNVGRLLIDYGDTLGNYNASVGSSYNRDDGLYVLNFPSRNPETTYSHEEIYEMVINDILGEGLVPPGWELVGTLEPEVETYLGRTETTFFIVFKVAAK